MKVELAQVVAGWPLAAPLAAAAVAHGLQSARRRAVLNEALHELRRPLQAIALASPAADPAGRPWMDSSVRMAAAALERLEREINGESVAAAPEAFAAEPLLVSAVGRWRGPAALAGSSLELRWRAGDALLTGDPCAIAQALDNLIVNSIEHGGPRISMEARLCRGRVRISVADSGRESPPEVRRERAAEAIARLSGRRRRGHGLRVVRRTAASHGGWFHLRHGERGTEAVLELPLPAGSGGPCR